MEICYICGVNGKRIKLYDAVYNGKNAFFCERCSIIENIPIIKKPIQSRINEARAENIYDRMVRISGIKPKIKKEVFFKLDRLKELESNPKLELTEKNDLDLVDHFHWEIMKNRRRMGLTQTQFAKYLRVPPSTVEMLELGNLPENAEPIIRKMEIFLHIQIIKSPLNEIFKKERSKEPVLLDEKGNKLEFIPEEEMTFKNEEVLEANKLEEDYIDMKKIDKNRVTIGDLRDIHKKRIQATKIEQIEEQKKIEERKRDIMALREKENFMMGKTNVKMIRNYNNSEEYIDMRPDKRELTDKKNIFNKKYKFNL